MTIKEEIKVEEKKEFINNQINDKEKNISINIIDKETNLIQNNYITLRYKDTTESRRIKIFDPYFVENNIESYTLIVDDVECELESNFHKI